MPTTTPQPPPPINRKQFMDWLAAQPQDRTFCYCACDQCLLATFFREACGVEVSVGCNKYRLAGTGRVPEAEAYVVFPDWLTATAVLTGCQNGGVKWLLVHLRTQPFERDEL